jgi:FkbH-like protein
MNPLVHPSWLPAAPEDFAAQSKALRNAEGDIGAGLRQLATHALDANQLQRLARLVADRPSATLAPFRLGLLSNATTDFVAPAITGSGARHGLAISCITTGYGQFVQEALEPGSAINRGACDAVLLALDARAFALDAPPGDEAAATAAVERALAQLDAICAGLQPHCQTLILQTAPTPADGHLGNFDPLLPGSPAAQVAAFNRGVIARCRAGPARLLDVAALAAQAGLAQWHDPAAWNVAKQPFAHSLIPAYSEALCRLIAAIRGKSRKALVLDLDNTLWAGVIGDDGMDGINIAQGDATGEAHLALQRYALELRERGVVLAVSSKNTDEVARQVFREHPDMLIREDHIAVFQANWNDKASNLKAIAEALNIGTDALVFVDDNPAERAQVRQALPEVAVPEMPADPAWYVRVLAAGSYFEAVGFANEDRDRARMYGENAKRAALQTSAGGIEDYLRSLAMTIRFAPFDVAGRARIAQLINKSNQFNLTTRRYSEAEIAALADDPAVFTLQVRLEDAFGDNGMISVVICRQHGPDWQIDTWLMSCRVLGRRVEQMVLAQLQQQAAARGIARLIGTYRPSGRNGIVADHYAKLGFALTSEDAEGNQTWTLQIDGAGAGDTAALFAPLFDAVIAEGFGTGEAIP